MTIHSKFKFLISEFLTEQSYGEVDIITTTDAWHNLGETTYMQNMIIREKDTIAIITSNILITLPSKPPIQNREDLIDFLNEYIEN